MSATTPKPVSSTASRASASACGRTAAAMASTIASICVCESSPSSSCAARARRASARASAIDARSRSVGGAAVAVGAAIGSAASRAWCTLARSSGLYHIAPCADNGGIMPSVRQLRVIVDRDAVAATPGRSAITPDLTTMHDRQMFRLLVALGACAALIGLRSQGIGRHSRRDAVGDVRPSARGAWQSRRGHLQVPGRRQRAGLRSGLPGLRALPRRRRRAHVDRRPRSGRADLAVEARSGRPVHPHDVHPGVSRTSATRTSGWACTRRAIRSGCR